MRYFFVLMLYVVSTLHCLAQISVDTIAYNRFNQWAYEVLHLPKLNTKPAREIIVAVIDDGFRTTHEALNDFMFVNTNEVSGNRYDDDQNGYIDDVQGWDVSDGDNKLGILKSNETTSFHGTFIASVITRIASSCYPKGSDTQIKILPVKVLADRSGSTAIMDGYKGIAYATAMGADIICCAWSGGQPNSDDLAIVDAALQKNILIIASAGNMWNKVVDEPASITGVYAVAAIDTSLHKVPNSNYGESVDLALPGMMVQAAFPIDDKAWFYGEGTSAAAALATGCAAVLKALKPEALPYEIMSALKNTSTPLDSVNLRYCGKLGAGLPNLTNAADYLVNTKERAAFFNSTRTQGELNLMHTTQTEWLIKPSGAYKAVHITPRNIAKRDYKKWLHVYSADSMVYSGQLGHITHNFSVPGSSAKLVFNDGKKLKRSQSTLLYFVETIDSSTLYCSDTQIIQADSGVISDNSGVAPYANATSCKWQITAPNSQRIHIAFDAFDTEAKIDYVWIFDGEVTNPEYLVAKFSGSEIPPEVTSRTNTVLVWFVTNETHTGNGWQMQFSGVKAP